EYKVMGLAPYGSPRYMAQMRTLLRATRDDFRLNQRYFRHSREVIRWDFGAGSPALGTMFSPVLAEVLGPPRSAGEPLTARHRDIAASAQLRLEEVLLPILDRLQRRTGLRALAMAGGVALNVTANSLIRAETRFDEVFIQPAASDAGTSIGAALFVAHQHLG